MEQVRASRVNQYSDLDFRFIANPNTGDVGLKKDVEAVRQSVLNILLTNHGEKPFRPIFGANLRAYLFEIFDDVQKTVIRDVVTNALLNYEPRVNVTNVEVSDLSYRNAVRIKVEFDILSPSEVTTDVEIIVERIR